jgi:hypothetical protein
VCSYGFDREDVGGGEKEDHKNNQNGCKLCFTVGCPCFVVDILVCYFCTEILDIETFICNFISWYISMSAALAIFIHLFGGKELENCSSSYNCIACFKLCIDVT